MRWLWPARLPLDREPVHDADTLWLELDRGFDDTGKRDLRMLQVWAPEIRQPGGHEAREFLVQRMRNLQTRPFAWAFRIETVKSKTGTYVMSFTRYIATIWRFFDGDSPPPYEESINYEVTQFLNQHPEWGGGIGS